MTLEAEAGDTGPYIVDVNIDRDVVLKYIQRIGQNKAPGADNIYPRVLKEVKVEVVDALVDIQSTPLITKSKMQAN